MSIVDLIPPQFRCPKCHKAWPSRYQWALTTNSPFRVLCRECLRANPQWLVSPLRKEEGQLPDVMRVYQAVELTAPQTVAIGDCVVCVNAKTRNASGYCGDCRLILLRDCHGGMGAYRATARGACFRVFEDGLDKSGNRHEAFYPYGRGPLPRRPSRESCQLEFDEQAAVMWQMCEENLDAAIDIAKMKGGKRYDEEAHDAAVLGLCKAAIYWNPERSTFKTFYTRVVTNELYACMHRTRKQLRSAESLHENMGEAALKTPEEPSPFLLIVQSPIEMLNSYGLTAYERDILYNHIVNGMTLEQLGRRDGVVKTTMHARIWRAKQKCYR